MTDDLTQILQSIMATQRNIVSRLAAVEESVHAAGTSELEVPARWGYCSPTSPPSDRILVRRGRSVAYYNTSRVYMGAWPDFQPSLSISAFTNAYRYRWVIPYMELAWWDPYVAFDTFEDAGEYTTYGDAVNDMENTIYAQTYISSWNAAIPLCAIIVRNDGTTGAVNHYLPITLANRSQSSFAVRDMRPWIYGVG